MSIRRGEKPPVVLHLLTGPGTAVAISDDSLSPPPPGGWGQWGTADAEIKDPPVEKPELKGSPFKS